MIDPVRETGSLYSFFPADLSIPMVAPNDLGEAAATRLMTSVTDTGVRCFEGPDTYSANDVAAAFARVMKIEVSVVDIPREALEDTFRSFGFSENVAASYACMTGRVIDGKTQEADERTRGSTTLEKYVQSIAAE